MNPETQLTQTDQITIATPSLSLPIDDSVIISTMSDAEQRGKHERAKYKIDERSESNVKFWRGDQVDERLLDSRYQMAHVDNVVHEDLEKQIQMAVGKIPDIFAAPPNKEDFEVEASRDIQQWLRERIDRATIKRLIKDGLRDMELKLTGVVKARWDYAAADFIFELIDPKDILFSEGSKIPQDGFTIDGTDIVFHYVEEPTSVVLAKFPAKANELKAEIANLSKNATDLPARLKYTECHFRWFDDKGRLSEGIAWRYGNVVLNKMKNPYYDYNNVKLNYFDRPRKPFMLFTYRVLGTGVYETTTTFEQGIPLNKIINKRRRQITEISDRAVPKLAFSGSVMDKETAKNISSSPNEGILLDGTIDDIRKGMMTIPATPPNPMLFQDMQDLRSRVDGMFSTHPPNLGTRTSGIAAQIAREADMAASDDLVTVVVERVVTEMAQWAMQFARLFYDDDRPAMRTTTEEGDTKFIELNRDKIETDIQVIIKASTSDKTTRRADAIQMLQGKITDPYTIFEDLDVPNPKERTKRLLSFIQAQQGGDWSKYLEVVGIDMNDDQASEAEAERDIELLVNGGQPHVDQAPDESYVSTFLAFVNGPDFAQLDSAAQQRLQAHIQALKAKVQMQANIEQGADNSQPMPGAPGQPPAGMPQVPGNAPPAVQQAVQGAPGVGAQPNAYGPQPDPSTTWQEPTAQAGQQPGPASADRAVRDRMKQRVRFPVTTSTQPGVNK